MSRRKDSDARDPPELIRCGKIWAAVAAALLASLPALAQLPPKPVDPNEREVYLVRRDKSDCTNSDVPNVDSPLVAGNVWVTRLRDGNTNVRVAMTAKPSTTYHFFLKCVRQLADIKTDEEGVAAPTAIGGVTNPAGMQ
jgi:hypothetical protein